MLLLAALMLAVAVAAVVVARERSRCTRESAELSISAARSVLQVGESLAVILVLRNTGCIGLGLPQYRLYVESEGGRGVLVPEQPESIVHSIGVVPGGFDEAVFVLEAVAAGTARLRGTASFEVHLGYPGPAYWGSTSSGGITVTVES